MTESEVQRAVGLIARRHHFRMLTRKRKLTQEEVEESSAVMRELMALNIQPDQYTPEAA